MRRVLLLALLLLTAGPLYAQSPRLLKGHADAVYGIAFSPDGRLLATGSYDQTVRLWEMPSGRVQHVLTGNEDQVFRVAFSPDGKQIASCGADGTVRIWSAVSGERVAVLKAGATPVMALAYSADGTRLACGDYDGNLKLWDVAQQKLVRSMRQPHPILSIAFAQVNDLELILSGDNQSTLRCWRADNGAMIQSRELTGHGALYGLSLNAKGEVLTTAGSSGALSLLDLATLDRQHQVDAGRGLFAVANSDDGKKVAAAGRDRLVRVWRRSTNKLTAMPSLHGPQETVLSLAFAPDNRVLAAGCYDGQVYLWSLK